MDQFQNLQLYYRVRLHTILTVRFITRQNDRKTSMNCQRTNLSKFSNLYKKNDVLYYQSLSLPFSLYREISDEFLFFLAQPILLQRNIENKLMSCSNKIDDLEDLAADLFEFDEDNEIKAKPKKQKTVKKKKLLKQKHQQIAKDQVENQQEYEPVLAEKAPGTHNIFVKTFGCSHNISDSEFMVGQLADYGYNMVDNPEDADLVLINSCTVVNPSQTAFINMVCKAKKIKKPIVVAGCVPQGQQGIPELQNVSAVGVTQIDRIVEVVDQTLKGHKVQLMTKKQLPSLDLPKIRKNKDIEIIPINAGCLGSCTYCKTVFARGKLLSYTPEAIVQRVKNVVNEGVKELWLTSQDTGAYGRDINTNISQLLISLCEQLKNHEKIMMRIGMTNPPYMLQHLRTIAHFLNHPRVFSFIHIPVQAGNNTVLQKMNRQYPVEDFTKICDYFLQHCPDVTIATDIICGFAQETDEQFQDSLKLIEKYKFRVVNINQFYLRPGTPAANLKQVPSQIVKNRSSKLTQLFKSYDKHGYMMGRQERVWINQTESHKGVQYMVGHTKNYTKVILPYEEGLLYTQVIVKITKCLEWHIEGQIIERNAEPTKIPENYVQKMKKDLEQEKELLKKKKQEKLSKLKAKKDQLTKKAKANQQVSNQKKEKQIAKKVENKFNEIKEKVQISKTQTTVSQQEGKSPRYQFLVGFIVLIVLAGGLWAMGY